MAITNIKIFGKSRWMKYYNAKKRLEMCVTLCCGCHETRLAIAHEKFQHPVAFLFDVVAESLAGGRHYSSDLPQGGLEVSCVLKFQSKNKEDAEKAEKLIRNSLTKTISDVLLVSLSVNYDQHQ